MSPDSDIPIADNVESLIQYAVRAPSSHNTQPWCFRVSGNCVFLYADRTRALPVNDPEDRILVGMMLVLPAGVQAARQLPVVHVAIVADGSPERVAALRTIFLEEMRAVNRGELDNQAPPDLQFEANRRDIYRWSIVLKGSSLLCELKINNDN